MRPEEQGAKRRTAAPASVLAQGVLRPVRARRKQGVKFLFVHGVASRDKILQVFSLSEVLMRDQRTEIGETESYFTVRVS